jgi:cell division septation protein DedD
MPMSNLYLLRSAHLALWVASASLLAQGAPKVLHFEINPTKLRPGDILTLHWKVKGAVWIRLEPTGVGLDAQGTLKLPAERSETFRLIAGTKKSKTSKSVTVLVDESLEPDIVQEERPSSVGAEKLKQESTDSTRIEAGFVVQVSALPTNALAEALRAKLETRFGPSFVEEDFSDHRPIFRVLLGPYKSSEEAQEVAKKIPKSLANTKPIVKKYP